MDLQDQTTAQDVVELLSAVDPAWIAAAEHAVPLQLVAAPSTADITAQLQELYARLTPQGRLVQLDTASVRAFTQLQLQPLLAQRASI